MAIPRFFVSASLETSATGTLDVAQTRQARSVLRLPTGAPVVLFDGSGVEAQARLTAATRHGITYSIESISRPDRRPPVDLTVGLALLKGDRFDFAVQKLTEIGVTQIVPLLTERCVVSFDDARDWLRRADRYDRIAREAAEQSERVTVPTIEKPTTLATFLRDQPVIALLERANTMLIGTIDPAPEMAIAIGPEGGWTEREAEIIASAAAGAMSLGHLILRAETAAIVAAGTIVQHAWANKRELGHGGN